jgi:hypothetical protein
VAQSVTFRYRTGGTTYTRTFAALAVRGLDEPDIIELVPPLQLYAADGHILEYIKGFRRCPFVTLGVLQEEADRTFMLGFISSPDRWICLGSLASVYCALADPEGFENEWKHGTSLMRYYDIALKENVIYTEWPALLEPSENMIGYISPWVEVTGTEASPQTFTTNAGALALQANGSAFPAISLVTHTVNVIITERQGSLVHRVGNITQAGTDISFTVAVAPQGNPYTVDGKFWVVFTVVLEVIP